MQREHGFTVIELIVAILIFIAAATLFFVQKNDLEVSARDKQRKTAINAIYYSLEKVYFKENKSYPQKLGEKTLPSVEPALFKDPNGKKIGDAASNYRYEPTGCEDGDCKGYALRTDLEKEQDFIKTNDH